MTISFIFETVEDRFYERGGEEPRPPRSLSCPVCGAELRDEVALAEHLGSAHPLSAPRLFINGEPIVGERLLHRRPPEDAVQVANATQILISQNGGPHLLSSAAGLKRALSRSNALVLDLTLRNRRIGDRGEANERLRIVLDVPNEDALDSADSAFEEILASDELDEHRLDRFADAVAEFRGASRYGSALHDYGVAILIKDQARGTSDSLPFAAHREKLHRALDVLRHFPERPLARAVCGFIRFSLNDFTGGVHPSGVPELDTCTAVLQELASVSPQRVSRAITGETGLCPTDAITGFILNSWNDPDGSNALADLAARGSTTPEDSAKCRALALRGSGRGASNAPILARSLMNDPVFGAWATRIFESFSANV